MLDFDTCDAARLRRDPAFDGMFFCAAKTTGVYCRPICRVRLPLRKNVVFFSTAAAAEVAGYRPCYRCRPEAAPFCPAWMGTKTTVQRALKLIEGGELDRQSVQMLAERLGVGTRHLDRLFHEYLGASPLQVATTTRVQRAKKLLDSTEISLGRVAEDAGFRSTRQMTRAFLKIYGHSPSVLRAA